MSSPEDEVLPPAVPNAFDKPLFSAAEADLWTQLIRWTIGFVRELLMSTPLDARPMPQRLLDGVAARFESEGTLQIVRAGQQDATVELARFTSATKAHLPRAVDLADAHEFASAIDLPDGRRATLTLRRPEQVPPLNAFERRWIAVTHQGCDWVYAPAAGDARGRLERLSPREREALAALLKGASEKEVALALKRSRHTVHSYVKRIYRTLGVRSKSQLRVVFGDVLHEVLGDLTSPPKSSDDDLLASPGH